MEAESGIGTASRAAPESIKEVFTNVHFHATQWYPIVAGSGIGTACRAAHKSMLEDIPAIMHHSGIKWKRSLAQVRLVERLPRVS